MRRFLALGLCALGLACQMQPSSQKKGTPVARGNGITITTDEFKARIDEQSPFIRQRYTTLERKKEFLDNLIRQEVLAAEAQKQGLDKDPDVQATLRKIMVQKLVQKRFQADPAQAPEVPEAELQKYYDDHKPEYVRARKVRAQIIVFATPTAAERAKKRDLAKKTLAKIRAEEKKNPAAFNQAVAAASEDAATKALAGDLQFRGFDELEKSYSKELAQAVFSLKPGETSNVIEAAPALYIVRFTGEQPEVNRTFDQVKAQIANKLSRERKTKEFDEWLKGLREKAQITVDEKALEGIEVAAAPVAGPGPGMPAMGGPMQMVPPGAGAPVPALPPPAAPAK